MVKNYIFDSTMDHFNHQKMGFDCYMQVFGKCELLYFLETTLHNYLQHHDAEWKSYFDQAIEWAARRDRLTFLNSFVLNFDQFEFNVEYQATDYNPEFRSYYTPLYLEAIITAVKENDPNLVKYLNSFDDLADFSINTNRVKIYIFSESSYKGGQYLYIDYGNIQSDINKLCDYYPEITVATKLGIS